MKVIGIIPARLASSRFPRKPLTKILGRSMTEHVYRRSAHAKHIQELYVATCDQEIADETVRFGGKAIMTSPHHTRGTDRVSEAAKSLQADVIINIQGDEPMIDPNDLDKVILMMQQNSEISCVNLVSVIHDWSDFVNPDVVKTTVDQKGRVLYFSRQPIPNTPEDKFKSAYRQLGVYFFKKDLLEQFGKWKETPLEISESVDMLRIIENGVPIYIAESKRLIGVDRPEDVPQVENALRHDALHQKLFESVRT